ncbi:MAG TPA: hypothetical protein DCY93_03655, partial [Firmicutes bacterium]|nr:hypothetical protein [Bacillota bacterium]
ISPIAISTIENMGTVNLRNEQTSRGWVSFSPWNEAKYNGSILQLTLGNNFISSLEIVSALNSLNLAHCQYHYNLISCTKKFNPKLYLGTIQTASTNWNYDIQNGLPELPDTSQKSGSWP